MDPIKHVESTVKVYFSRDYGQFKFMRGNRDLSESKIKKIMKSINEDGVDVLKYCPVLVDQDMQILDGQHRFTVSKQLGRPVFYIMTDKIDIRGVARINSNSSNWKTLDFLNSFCDQGKLPYLKVRELCEEYGCRPNVPAALIHNGSMADSGSIAQVFKDGELQIRHYDHAKKILDLCSSFKSYCDNPFTRSIVSAVDQIHDNGMYDHNLMLSQLKNSGQRLPNVPDKKTMLQHMETIINWHKSKRIVIF